MPEEDSAVVGLIQKYFSLVEQGNNIYIAYLNNFYYNQFQS